MTNLEGKIQKREATLTSYARGLNTASNIPKMNWAGPIESLLCLVSSNRYPCADHAHEYKEKRKQEKLPRFALGRCRRQSLALLLALGSPIGEQARVLRAKDRLEKRGSPGPS